MASKPSNTQNNSHKIEYVLSWQEYDVMIRGLAYRIERAKGIKGILGIKRGGLVPAVHLSHLLRLPCVTTRSDLAEFTLVVDDVSDTGRTLVPYQTAGYPIATLFSKPQTQVIPNYFAKVVPDDTWIIFPWEV